MRKISPPPGFDPLTIQPGSSVTKPTELPGPQLFITYGLIRKNNTSAFTLGLYEEIISTEKITD
jgi:hypothetical protein